MTPVGMAPVKVAPGQQVQPNGNSVNTQPQAAPLEVSQNTVTLSAEGKALLAALQQIEQDGKTTEAKADKTVGDKVESFAHGALGMEHPDKLKEEEDDSYSAGQYMSAALTIGGILLALA
ncbi:hypothetical protein [Vibrio sp.]|uniref:hypothetical protein n=1 Tax=Vibrio sp. TaxID=678 RepID=UPI003D13C3C5